MKIVLTNDDGISAPGLEATLLCLQGLGEDVTVVAPTEARSGVGHQVTTRLPIVVNPVGEKRYSVHGTPADCSRLALKEIVPDADWVIAGINSGANLGSDVYNSGTVAAAREAAILGCRAIAVSQYVARDHRIDWQVTGHHAGPVVRLLLNQVLDSGFFWNVNLPHPLKVDTKLKYQFCELDTHPHKYNYRREENTYIYEGTIHERPRDSGKDVDVCFQGKVSITRVPV
jgi:5'-nucleotidase